MRSRVFTNRSTFAVAEVACHGIHAKVRKFSAKNVCIHFDVQVRRLNDFRGHFFCNVHECFGAETGCGHHCFGFRSHLVCDPVIDAQLTPLKEGTVRFFLFQPLCCMRSRIEMLCLFCRCWDTAYNSSKDLWSWQGRGRRSLHLLTLNFSYILF